MSSVVLLMLCMLVAVAAFQKMAFRRSAIRLSAGTIETDNEYQQLLDRLKQNQGENPLANEKDVEVMTRVTLPFLNVLSTAKQHFADLRTGPLAEKDFDTGCVTRTPEKKRMSAVPAPKSEWFKQGQENPVIDETADREGDLKAWFERNNIPVPPGLKL